MTDESDVPAVPADLYNWLADEAHPGFARRFRHSTPGDYFADAAAWGAGWAFAIIGMAEAIRRRQPCSICEPGNGWWDEERRLCMRCDPDCRAP